MPRINVSEEEVAYLEAARARTAVARAYNEGLDRARELFDAWIEHASTTGPIANSSFHEAVQSERRNITL